MFKKILVPLDGSPIAAEVLTQVAELATTMKAKVTLLHVSYSDVGAPIGEASPGMIEAVGAQAAKFCAGFLSQAVQDLEAQGLTADWVCREGAPAREIIAFAQDNGYDLIALGTHGQGEVAWNLGGVADRVAAHATVPVLVFRTFKMRPPVLKGKIKQFVKDAELYFAWSLGS